MFLCGNLLAAVLSILVINKINMLKFKYAFKAENFQIVLQAALRMDKHTPKERRQERVEEVMVEVNV